eukprot:scaffold7033_cov257-Pinguiococcus_pyrenoidosus.AAC.8
MEVDRSRREGAGGRQRSTESFRGRPKPKGAARNFQQRLQRAPTQLLRYEWDGQPLLGAAVGLPDTSSWTCQQCGAAMGFECQLMPNVLNVLAVDAGTHLPEEVLQVKGIADVVIEEGAKGRRILRPTPQLAEGSKGVNGEVPKLELRYCGDYMDFTTVCIYSCSNSCQAEGAERVFVQP